jgi:hypothetical protein
LSQRCTTLSDKNARPCYFLLSQGTDNQYFIN